MMNRSLKKRQRMAGLEINDNSFDISLYVTLVIIDDWHAAFYVSATLNSFSFY